MDEKDLVMRAVEAIEEENLLVIDRDGIIVHMSRGYENTLGLSREELKGAFLPEARPGSILYRIVKKGEKETNVLRIVGEHHVLCNFYPIRSGDGEVIGGVSFSKSIVDTMQHAKIITQYTNLSNQLLRKLKDIQTAKYRFDDIVAQDMASISVRKRARQVAEKDIDVLILGESGVGKEVYAQAIHNASRRSDESFVALNCAAIQGNLLESELFGYEEGAFTGAKKGGKIGLFEAANGGSIFLDEISELNGELQAKLLRALQERTVRRVGGTTEIPINVRVLSACNVSLEERVAQGAFRNDLYYRLAVFTLEILPLRSRKGDIIALAAHYLKMNENKLRRRIDIHEDAKRALLSYDWPGNARELRNAIEYAVVLMQDFTIMKKDLPQRVQDGMDKSPESVSSLKDKVREFEKAEIARAVDIFGDTLEGKKQAAEALGISLATLYKKTTS